uniref:Uncharacterized protein n=1 Tax=Helianthus annuus TaxID=4232 RepID=A0A251VJF6_HELAN
MGPVSYFQINRIQVKTLTSTLSTKHIKKPQNRVYPCHVKSNKSHITTSYIYKH